jgi:hypothetical protein
MDIHSCSYFCERHECIKTQRDELRAKVESQSKIIAELTFNQRLQDAATAAVQERAEKAEANLAEMQWQPIETAPKDGTNIMVACPRLGVCCPAHWDNDQYAKKPRPYWTHWGERIWGITWVRNDQPTHWMPLRAAPIDAEMKK